MFPSDVTEFEYCITTNQLLSSAGFDVGNFGGGNLDTVIIMQPTKWYSDIVGHGTAVASALCGQGELAIQGTSSPISGIKFYMGSARGAKVFVVNTETLALVIPDFPSAPLTVDTALQNKKIEDVILEAQANGVNTFYMDYDYRYLGKDMAMNSTIRALLDAENAIISFTSNPRIILLEMSVLTNRDQANTYCDTLAAILRNVTSIAVVTAAGNEGADVAQLNFAQSPLFEIPAQCSRFNNTLPAVLAARGIVLGLQKDGSIILDGLEGNYDLDISLTNNTLWSIEPGYFSETDNAILKNITVGTTKLTLNLTFGGPLELVPCGSILYSGSATTCNFMEPILGASGIYDPTHNSINVTIYDNLQGTSIAAAHLASTIALATLSSLINGPADLTTYLFAISRNYVKPPNNVEYGLGNLTLDVIYDYLLKPSGMTSGYPFNVPPTNEGALPGSGEANGASPSTSTLQPSTGTQTYSTPLTVTTLKFTVPAPALLALFGGALLRKRRK
jgi:hypothetical protein